jgi:hypothetical protein
MAKKGENYFAKKSKKSYSNIPSSSLAVRKPCIISWNLEVPTSHPTDEVGSLSPLSVVWREEN